MNLVIHQLNKDVRRTRVVLAFWFLLVVLQFTLVGWTAKPGDVLMQSILPMLSGVLAFFNYVLVLVLVPILIHQEPLVGTTAFWFTRPIARGTVLASKALFLLFLIVLPIMVQSIAFLANGVTVHDVCLAAPELLLSELSWVLVLATLAVLTPSFSRFAIVGAIVLVVFYLCYFVVQMVVLLRNPQAYLATPASLNASRTLVSSLFMIGLGLAVVLVQYLARRFTLAISLAIMSVVAAILIGHFWPWNFMKPADPLVQDSTLSSGFSATPTLSSVSTSDQPAIRGGNPLKEVSGNIFFQQVPKGYVIAVDSINSILKENGKILPTESGSPGIGVFENADANAVELGLGGVPVLNMDDNGRPDEPLFSIDAVAYGRYATTPLDYSAALDCTIYKYVARVQLPLVKGARMDDGSEHLVITDVLYDPKGITINLRHKNVKLEFAPKGRDGSEYAQNQSSPVYLLVNKKRREAIMQKLSYSVPTLNGVGILINEPLQVPFGPNDANGGTWLGPLLNKSWLADAVLVRLDLAPVVRFKSEMNIPGFRLDGKFKEGPSGTNRTADLDTLDQIKLPHDATRDQVREYVNDILIASRRVSEDEHDPQIGMMEKVGTQNVDLLVQRARASDNFYLNHAIDALAQPDDKEMILETLGSDRDLIDTVIDHDWQTDAKPVLLKAIAEKTPRSGYYPEGWYIALASLKDPSTYDALKTKYVEDPDPDLFNALKPLPNFDLAGTVDQAWKNAQMTGGWKVREMFDAAAQFGEPDVIDVAVKSLKSSGDDYGRQKARKILRNYIPAVGKTDAELIDWVQKNRANLSFDKEAGKFEMKSSPSPTTIKPGH